ncbi:4-diphosphocytidyl-2C-methyl-D-erythritol kinase [Afipia sp. Root123D2]|uniref:4-(cytidine 5'-diphospho)-2-C-methyl-D-erythritol kinase n=1 Tax=Afipia sp. Root123D2 TaxID=1736436 RepID=UPI0006F5CC70|nr:4-(cytidine 5'-diphospho)-2-C-methyl-D-erythritol kinase [Afipia sp. Root123D2]KQW20776.1 4-diphosphocytidyl-2C-methyl-D-erythritol kinase [Afipia sp. Root123D2]
MQPLIETARAKVNLTLRVLGRRPDGYHDIDSVVAFADCVDTLAFAPGGDLSLTTTGPGADACGDSGDNLIIRATRALAECVPGLTLGRFSLDKHLPVAAGIGGGSADAAAALRLLATANGIVADDERLSEAARVTGADIPVCLASRACSMQGIGDELAALDLPELPCVMINPRVAVATKDVFAELGLKKGQFRVGISEVLEAVTWPKVGASADVWLDFLKGGANDLEAPALRVEPIIGDVLTVLRETDGVRLARMSGSGATCFAIYGNADDAKSAGQAIAQAHPGWWVHAGVLS